MNAFDPSLRIRKAVMAAVLGGAFVAQAQLIYQEGFNDDGTKTIPVRYELIGREAYEADRHRAEVDAASAQAGPVFWSYNKDVSFVGVPDIPARRMIFTWRPTADISAVSDTMLKLFDSSVRWLLDGKVKAKIVAYPTVEAIGGLADRLIAAGHEVVADDSAVKDSEVVGDLFIHANGGGNPSRFVRVSKPVIVINSPDLDDMIVGSIGTAVNFEPGKVSIASEGHPAAGGLTGSFDGFTGDQGWELTGRYLAAKSIVLATVEHTVPPAVTRLGDLDDLIAGTKANEKTTEKTAAIDFSDNSSASWTVDNPIPGGYAGSWGLNVTGKISVSKAGTYRFALGTDDGGRISIDLDKNGLGLSDVVLEDLGPHGHTVIYGNVKFDAAGDFDFQIISYNASGAGSLEVSVSNVEAQNVTDDALDSGSWDLLATTGGTGPVKLSSEATVTAYKAAGKDTIVKEPLMVLLNGPNDTPKGFFYGGGAFEGYEGTGFLAGAAMNKWPFPEGLDYRGVKLKPINVAGKSKVKLTIALAGAQVDFEDNDFIDIGVFPKGEASERVQLAYFRGVENGVQPWLADKKEGFVRRLTRQFQDFTYDIPSGATDLIVDVRVRSTWWNEILALDNIRIASGVVVVPDPLKILGGSADAKNFTLSWSGGSGPYLVQGRLSLTEGGWTDLVTTSDKNTKIPLASPMAYFRVSDGSSKSVTLYGATLDAVQEGGGVVSDGKGQGLLSVQGTTATYVVSYSGLKDDATLSHVHGPAARGANAGVAFGLVNPTGRSGMLVGQATITPAQAADIEAGKTYFNIHTKAFGGGEIRGQIEKP